VLISGDRGGGCKTDVLICVLICVGGRGSGKTDRCAASDRVACICVCQCLCVCVCVCVRARVFCARVAPSPSMDEYVYIHAQMWYGGMCHVYVPSSTCCICAHLCTYVHTCVRVCILHRLCVHACPIAHACTHSRTRARTCMYTLAYTRAHMVYTYIYTLAYMRTYTRTHAHDMKLCLVEYVRADSDAPRHAAPCIASAVVPCRFEVNEDNPKMYQTHSIYKYRQPSAI